MKKSMKTALVMLGLICMASCNKETENGSPSEIVLSVGDDTMDLQVNTKATAISSVPSSLYYSMTTGTVGSNEANKKSSTSGTVSGGKISTGLYQTASATAYNYYVSNSAITFNSKGSTIAASNTLDVIAGKTSESSVTPSVTLEHVFARTGTLTLNTQTGYTLSNVSWTIVSKSGGTGGTAGTYNMATGSWSGLTALSSQAITSSSDLYLTPGVYTIGVSYTLSLGDWTSNFTKSADVTLVAGCVNNISGTASGGSASQISISVSLTAWGTNSISATFN